MADSYPAWGGWAVPFGRSLNAFVNGPNTDSLQSAGMDATRYQRGFAGLNTPMGEGQLATSLWGQINGAYPSVAESELNQQTAKNAQQQLGFASGLGGLNAALSRRVAADNIGRMNQEAIGQQQMVRAKEIADAQQGLGNLYKTQGEQQAQQEQIEEKAFADQSNAQTENRKVNADIGKSFSSGLGSLIAGI